MSDFSTSALEFESIRQVLGRYVQTPEAGRWAQQSEPRVNRDWIEREIENVSEARQFLDRMGAYSLADLADPRPLLQKLKIGGSLLDGFEILQLAEYLSAAAAIRALIKGKVGDFPRLADLVADFPDTGELQKEIRKKILPSGQLDDRASHALSEIRQELVRVRARLHRALESFMAGPAADQLVQDAYITIRNGRFVIPAKVESQPAIRGVVHGSSSSGATVFLEPLGAIELNNDLIRLQDQEREEIRRILLDLSDRLRQNDQDLRRTIDGITELDWRLARARFSQAYRCSAPVLSETYRVDLRAARHPLLIERLGYDGVVAIDLALGAPTNALIISGPNTGGKTVALKTLGLLVLMAQAGLPVPAGEAHLPVFQQVLVDIGDHQSISENLSTFSAHILNLASIVERLAPPALVLIDEIGTGTDPEQGAALAVALFDFFRRQGALVAATTHFHKVKEYGYTHPGVENASVEFNEQTLRPTYRLLQGTAGCSSGLEIAERLGLRTDIVAEARQLMEQRTLQADSFLRKLRQELQKADDHSQRLRDEALRLREQQRQTSQDSLAQQMRQQKEFQKMVEEKLKNLEQSFLKEARGSLRKAEDKLQAAQLRREQERKARLLKEKFLLELRGDPSRREAKETLHVGDRVAVPSLRQAGRILELTSTKAVVDVGGKRLSLSLSDVEAVAGNESATTKLPDNIRLERVTPETSPELNLIGCSVDEALERTDRFLDQAVLSHHGSVRIIHGYGTGRLRRALAEFLKGHPHVGAARLASSEEGGGGVTVVELG